MTVTGALEHAGERIQRIVVKALRIKAEASRRPMVQAIRMTSPSGSMPNLAHAGPHGHAATRPSLISRNAPRHGAEHIHRVRLGCL